jgi:hypothetical protein
MSVEMVTSNINLKETIYDHFIKGTNIPVPKQEHKSHFIDSSLLKLCINELYMNTPAALSQELYLSYEHLAFPNEEKRAFDAGYYDFLSNYLNNPVTSKLLYKATQENFSIERFHELCDDKEKTLTIIRT